MGESTKKTDSEVPEPAPFWVADRVRLRNVPEQDLSTMFEAHKKWLRSDGKEGQKADFQRANLDGAKLQGALLAYANLQEASLQSADLEAADLSGANLQGANLRGANFQSQSALGKEATDGEPAAADLTAIDLRNANLKDAKLSDVTGLQLQSLAGADLTNAKLPDDIARFEALIHVEEISKNARKVFLAMVGACVYSWLTIATTTDAALLVNTASSPLPIIQTKVPIAGFYWAAPVILLTLYLYLHLYLQNLWQGLASLPAKFPDGRALDERAYPWLLISLVRAHMPRLMEKRPPFTRLTVLLSVISAWMLVPATLGLFWLRYLPCGDWTWTCVHISILVLAVCFGAAFFWRVRATLRGHKPLRFSCCPLWRNFRLYAYGGTAVAVAAFALLISDGVINGVPAERKAYVQPYAHRFVVPKIFRFFGYIPFLDLVETELSVKPAGWTGLGDESPSQIAQVQKARLQYRSLRYANLEGAFLVKADLTGVDLRGANLQHADLRYARLWGATLEGAVVHQANLQEAKFRSTKLDSVILHSTKNLTQFQLKYACSNMAPKWLPQGMTIEPCPKDRDWPLRPGIKKWPHGW